MSTGKDSAFSANDENTAKFDYGRLSPSSWDDSNDDLSDGDSIATVEIPANDRRQSLARVRRRTRSISSPVFDADSAKDSSDEFVTYVSYSGKADSREATSPDPWNDWDSEEIISGIENYMNEKRLSLIRSKIAGNRSKDDEYGSVLNGNGIDQTEVFGGVDFHTNLNGKLSKIVEVEESKSNKSFKSSETHRSALPLSSENSFAGCDADGISYCDTHRGITAADDADRVVSMKYSTGDKFQSLTDDSDSDDSDVWRGIRLEIKRKNSEYVSSSLKYIFNGKITRESPNNGSERGEGETFGNELCDGENRKGNESITPNGVADLPEKTLENVSSKETIDLGLNSLFHLGQEHFRNEESDMPCSGREAFLVRESWNVPNSRSDSRRVRGNHTISLTQSEKLSNCLKESDQILYFMVDCGRNQFQGGCTERDTCHAGESFSEQGSPKNDPHSSSDKWLKDCKNRTVSDDKGSCSISRQTSPASFRNKILLDLNLSDNEDKCSTTERMGFSDSPENGRNPGSVTLSPRKNSPILEENAAVAGKSGTGPAVESDNGNTSINPDGCHKFGSGDSKWNTDETIGRKDYIPQDRGDITYERPDTKPGWDKLITSLEGVCPSKKPRETVFWVDIGKNRPDCHFQGSTDSQMRHGRTGNESAYTSKTLIPKKRTERRMIKARKRKRESVLNGGGRVTGEIHIDSQNQWGNKLFDRRGNWLANTVTRREDALTRGKRWFQALMVTRKRGRRLIGHQRKWHSSTQTTRDSSKCSDCFCNLFKQIVNIFTVSRKSRK